VSYTSYLGQEVVKRLRVEVPEPIAISREEALGFTKVFDAGIVLTNTRK